MRKNLFIVLICMGLGATAIGFQNCGSQAEFSNDEVFSKQELSTIIDNDVSLLATEEQKRSILEEMDEVMNQDPRTVEEPLSDVMDENEGTGEITLREEAKTYECTKQGNLSYSQKKYMVCHVPGGDYAKAKTLCLPTPGAKAHLRHFKNEAPTSYMGPCK